MRERLAGKVPPSALGGLPSSWQRLGRVLVLWLPATLEPWRSEVAQAYAEVLGCGAVLQDAGPIRGAAREPERELLWGEGTETVHLEGGVRYSFDAARLMWSAGNVHERQRLPPLVRAGEVVVDLFAGFGYFTLPIAVKAAPGRVVACEQNPLAFAYLQRNLVLNRCGDRVTPLPGDCRTTAPRGVADRVLLGYTVETQEFLPTALAALKAEGGMVHYHEAAPAHAWDRRPWGRVRDAAAAEGWRTTLQGQRIVKNYSPGFVHVVVDAEVRP